MRGSPRGLDGQEELIFTACREVAPGLMSELPLAGWFVQRAENGRVVIEVKGRRAADLHRPAGMAPVRHVAEVEFCVSGRPDELPSPQRAKAR